MSKDISRRSFLKTGTAAAVGLSMAPGMFAAPASKKKASPAPMDRKLKILGVGIGGRGAAVLSALETEEIIGLCDVDTKYAAHVFDRYPNAKRYTDYRKMYEELLDEADAVVVATADHTHAIIAAEAIAAGKHVYCEKPLVHSIYEARLLTKLAEKHHVSTQMGNQGASEAGVRKVCEWIWNGEIGEVTKVEAFTDRPIWPQGLHRPEQVEEIPSTLNWDCFIGPAPMRPYNSIYTPWNFRGWWDFGTGALGDMACHTMNLAFRGLELADVSDAECIKIEQKNDIAYPSKSIVKLTYRARDSKIRPGVKLPAVTLYWYDGYDMDKPGKSALKPPAEKMEKVIKTFGEIPNTGCYIVGSKGAVLMQDDYGGTCALALNDDAKFIDVFHHEAAKAVARRIPFRSEASAALGKSSVQMSGFGTGQYIEFLDAINGTGSVYDQTHSRCFSDVEYSIPQMEGILVGCIAQRVPGKLSWCSKKQRFDNEAANALVKPYLRTGFAY